MMKIRDTQAFKRMDHIQQRITLIQRKRVTDSVKMLKTIGVEKWETLNKGWSPYMKELVKELAGI